MKLSIQERPYFPDELLITPETIEDNRTIDELRRKGKMFKPEMRGEAMVLYLIDRLELHQLLTTDESEL